MMRMIFNVRVKGVTEDAIVVEGMSDIDNYNCFQRLYPPKGNLYTYP